MQVKQVLVFSDDKFVRDHVVFSIDGVLNKDFEVEITECATAEAVMENLNNKEFDALVMYGQTYKEGAMAVAKRIQGEMGILPKIIMIVERQQDAWLSKWAGASKIVTLPVKPNILRQIVLDIFKGE